MKKYLSVLIVAVLMICALAGCSGNTQAGSPSDEALQIVTTIFPAYDWTKNILGDNPANAEVTMLVDNGVDLHSYQPSAEDILKIKSCDLFIYVGGESDEWAEDAVRGADNASIKLLDALGDAAREEELVEGMESHEEAHDEEDHTQAPEYDEHVWLSLKNAALLTDSIESALEALDPQNAGLYKKNAGDYQKKLADLDKKYSAAIAKSSRDTLLFGDRFPFRYLTEDYGLRYYAAFAGCSAETEASFETITFLSQKADELSLDTVLTIDGSDQKIAETIVSNTASKSQRILTLDSMQSVTSGDSSAGVTYLSIMEDNLRIIDDALN